MTLSRGDPLVIYLFRSMHSRLNHHIIPTRGVKGLCDPWARYPLSCLMLRCLWEGGAVHRNKPMRKGMKSTWARGALLLGRHDSNRGWFYGAHALAFLRTSIIYVHHAHFLLCLTSTAMPHLKGNTGSMPIKVRYWNVSLPLPHPCVMYGHNLFTWFKCHYLHVRSRQLLSV